MHVHGVHGVHGCMDARASGARGARAECKGGMDHTRTLAHVPSLRHARGRRRRRSASTGPIRSPTSCAAACTAVARESASCGSARASHACAGVTDAPAIPTSTREAYSTRRPAASPPPPRRGRAVALRTLRWRRWLRLLRLLHVVKRRAALRTQQWRRLRLWLRRRSCSSAAAETEFPMLHVLVFLRFGLLPRILKVCLIVFGCCSGSAFVCESCK